ncbi:MAG: elongation factor P maturation arginine rhamnosyltransferase EarP [Methylophilaceae bacterium]
MKNQKKWDIFCKVVDNFGDIGVCWRLATQLYLEHGLEIRLFVNDLEAASKIMNGVTNEVEQIHEGISIVRWDEETTFDSVADVVIETFSCELPDVYLRRMHEMTVWVNVDYLSAEAWVPEFHGLNSKYQQTKTLRHFYFPGFSTNTGGLLREQTLGVARDCFKQSDQKIQDFWQSLLIDNNPHSLKISFFSYTNAPIEPFLNALVNANQSVSVFMPMNRAIPTSLLGQEALEAGDSIKAGSLHLYILPFLSQVMYDKLLWACDINFVRGEDSWVRAVWAGKPFVWQPYWQTDDAHLLKLNAFLDQFYGQPAFKKTLTKLHEDWSTQQFEGDVWHDYLENLDSIVELTQQQSNMLMEQKALATRLVDFCANLAK